MLCPVAVAFKYTASPSKTCFSWSCIDGVLANSTYRFFQRTFQCHKPNMHQTSPLRRGWEGRLNSSIHQHRKHTYMKTQHLYTLSLTPGSLEGARLRAGCHGDPFFALCSPCALCPDDCPPQLKGSRHTHTHASQMLSCIHIHTHTHGVLPGKPTKLQLLSCWFNLSLQSKRVDSPFKLIYVCKQALFRLCFRFVPFY